VYCQGVASPILGRVGLCIVSGLKLKLWGTPWLPSTLGCPLSRSCIANIESLPIEFTPTSRKIGHVLIRIGGGKRDRRAGAWWRDGMTGCPPHLWAVAQRQWAGVWRHNGATGYPPCLRAATRRCDRRRRGCGRQRRKWQRH
jgi:hypothetical protein